MLRELEHQREQKEVSSESRTVLGGNKLGFWSPQSCRLTVSIQYIQPHLALLTSEK